jgi:cytidylate kinase
MDREIEKKTYDTFKNETHHVIEAWLAGFVARDLPKVLRIYLYCSDNALRVDRIANRDKVSTTEAKNNI